MPDLITVDLDNPKARALLRRYVTKADWPDFVEALRVKAIQPDPSETSQLYQALGLLSTLAPEVIMDPDDPVAMAHEIVASVTDTSETTITRGEFMADGYELPKSGRVRVVDEEGDLRIEIGSDPSENRGGNWTKPPGGEQCFQGEGEVCTNCGGHIRHHFGGTEYRCQPKPDPSETGKWVRPAIRNVVERYNGEWSDQQFVNFIMDALGMAPGQGEACTCTMSGGEGHFADCAVHRIRGRAKTDIADLVKRVEALEMNDRPCLFEKVEGMTQVRCSCGCGRWGLQGGPATAG